MVALVITGGGGLIVKVKVALPVPLLLVALMVTLYVPAVVGVPEMAPVLVFTVKPEGSPVALKLVGLLVAVGLESCARRCWPQGTGLPGNPS